MNPSIEVFNAKRDEIIRLLEIQKQLDVVSGESAAQQRDANEEQIAVLLFELKRFAVEKNLFSFMQGIIRALHKREQRLRGGPRFATIKEAQSILKYPNLTILAIEQTPTTGREIPMIAQITALDSTGAVLIDYSSANDDVKSEPLRYEALVQIWPTLLSVTSGHYTLWENTFELQMQLMDIAKRFGLEIPVVIGQSFLDLCQRYFGLLPLRPSLPEIDPLLVRYDIPTLCNVLGISLPELSHLTALEATGMLRLLEAMAQGETGKSVVPGTDHNDHTL